MVTGIDSGLTHVYCSAPRGGHRRRHRPGHPRRNGGGHRLRLRAVRRPLTATAVAHCIAAGYAPGTSPALRLLQQVGHRLLLRAEQPRRRADGHRPRLRARPLQRAEHRRLHLRSALERRRRRRRSLTEPTSPTLADSKFLTRGGRGVPRRPNTYRSKLQELAPAGLSASDLPELTGRTRGESPTPTALNCSAAC